MELLKSIIPNKKLDKDTFVKVLKESLKEEDFYSRESLSHLKRIGILKKQALICLAYYKSKFKYGYELSMRTLSHLLYLTRNKEYGYDLKKPFESPFFLMKAGWLYEHAPFFVFFNEKNSKVLDNYIKNFAVEYSIFLNNKISYKQWTRNRNPRRVMESTFWDKTTFDPLLLVQKALNKHIEGIELCIDFHPFNYTNILPEEISKEKREQIKETCKITGIKLDIHSPIIGPYAPFPNALKGTQLFFDPLNCFDIQCETIDLAKDIGARSVVVHLIEPSDIKKWVDLISAAEGSHVRVTLENYCLINGQQNSEYFISCVDEIFNALPKNIRKDNFGITLDVGHFNIEGEDPLLASEKIGRWSRDKKIFIRMHATDNYGKLLFNPPAYSADIHNNVSGRGINNFAIVNLLRSMGHKMDVVAEQIQPLTASDISIIHKAQSVSLNQSFDELVQKGKERVSTKGMEELITPDILKEDAYLFLIGLRGIGALREHLVFRKIQNKKYLSVDEAKKISQYFMRMPQKFRIDLIDYMDDLLLPIYSESGTFKKTELDLICQNISGALFAALNNEHLNQIFSETITYNKGDIICEQNKIGQEMYFIKSGGADVYINKSLVARLCPGEIFGELSLFYNIKRTATIKAAKNKTKIGILSRQGLENLLKMNKPHSRALIFRLFNILPERLRNLNDQYKTAINSLQSFLGKTQKSRNVIQNKCSVFKIKTDLIPLLSSEEAQQIFTDIKVFKKNQVIIHEGDKADGAYYILEGKVKAATTFSDSKVIILGELTKNDIFGEIALIDEKPRSTTIIAATACKIAFMKKDTFFELIDSRSDLSFRLMAYICLSIFWRILKLDNAYADLKKEFS